MWSRKRQVSASLFIIVSLGLLQTPTVDARVQPTSAVEVQPTALVPGVHTTDSLLTTYYSLVPAEPLLASSCSTFDTRGDFVHWSRSSGTLNGDASGHGWWVNRGCSATQARVTVSLYEAYSDGTWLLKVTNSTVVKARNDGGARANARRACDTRTITGWASIIDADLIGQNDPADVYPTDPADIACRVTIFWQ